MPVYTLNPSHRRATKRKASSTPSLRERVAAKRRNPEKKHIVLTLHDDRVTWRTSDGRTGSEPKKANFSSGPTTNALLRRLGVIKDGVFQHEAWGIDVLNEDGFPIARFRNPLSEDGVVVSNPAKRRSGGRAQKAGLAKGQSLMAQAAAAYRAGKYPTMQAALKGVARAGAARKNPLSEDGLVVSNPAKRKAGAKSASKRTAAQSNAAKAMKLFHSGKASSLAEAWEMVRRGR